MKERSELQPLIDQISCPDSPVGMDAVYVHALILDRLAQIEARLSALDSDSTEVEDEA